MDAGAVFPTPLGPLSSCPKAAAWRKRLEQNDSVLRSLLRHVFPGWQIRTGDCELLQVAPPPTDGQEGNVPPRLVKKNKNEIWKVVRFQRILEYQHTVEIVATVEIDSVCINFLKYIVLNVPRFWQ